ncbi:MAG: T9SS type A sorting domain-containing protein [Flavobacteriales bacterium]|nr:T9SS type A sorting domain-containing protein [Flavobacteriales bacterium]
MMLFINQKIKAQEYFECYIDSAQLHLELDSVAKITANSTNGKVFTAKGNLKVLVIYAGFTNDKEKQGGYNPNTGDTIHGVTWPYYDLNGDSLNTFPKNIGDNFYADYSDFAPGNTDKSISNYFYQMSLPSGNPLKIIAEVFPERINVTAEIGKSWTYYNQWVLDTINAKYPGYDFSSVDNRTNNPNYLYDYSVFNQDNKIDYLIIVWRYSQNCNTDPAGPFTLCNYSGSGGGFASISLPSAGSFIDSLGDPTYYVTSGFTACKGMNGLNKTLFTHELAHTLYGAPHCNGANTVVGDHFYTNYGWGMMRSGEAPNVYDCANGWERWYNGWIELTSDNNTVSSEINSIADLQNNGIYTLHDFIKTGDVIRVKLPHVSNQYLWLENHTGANIFDTREGYTTNAIGTPLPETPKGLVGYVENTRYSRGYTNTTDVGANTIKYLNASGNFDYTNDYANPEPSVPEWWAFAYDFEKVKSNPLAGHNPLTEIRNDYKGSPSVIDLNTHWNNPGNTTNEMRHLVKQDGSFTYGILGYGMQFPTGSGANMGANPVVTNLQLYDDTNYQLSPIYLNGISFRVLSYNADSSVTVQIKMDDYDINNSTRYTGNIILSPNVVSSSTPSLNIKTGQNLDIDKSGTPNRHTITADNDFINPTVFTCESGSYFHAEVNSTVNVLNGSSLHLKSGSKLELEAGAALRIQAHSSLIIDNGAELNLKPGSFLIIDDSATVIWKNSTTNKGILVGSTSYTGNPAIVEVYGDITFTSGAKWLHNRDGFYRFHPTNSVFFQYPSSVNFTGKGKTRKMVELTNNTTLSISNVDDVDWNSGLVQYGSNSKIELNNVNFTSINATYNPASNPQTTSTAFEIINPQATFFNACDFNKLNKGVVVNGNGALVHIQGGKFTDMNTYGVELDDVSNFKMTNGFVNGANTCLYASNSNVIEINSTELKNASYGAHFEYVTGAYFSGANIQSNNVGIRATGSLVFLRNGARVHQSTSIGVEIYGSYDAGLGNYNAMLTMGDIGCGSVYNNSNYGIYGVDALLNIDAVQHSIDRGDNIIRPNRFDNNAYKTFEICYGSSAYAPSQINAKGNFWGVTPPDIQASQYSFTANACLSQGGTPVNIPLIHTNYSTCVPTNSCMDCSSGGGGGSSSSSSMMAVQTSFSEANEVFVEEDNTATRNGFTNLSAVELIKDTVTDTWKGKSVNEVIFNLEKESVHLIQVSKAIKAKANNSTGRMMFIVEDVFKDVKPEGLGVTSTVSLYPNPTNDKLFIDVERIDNYRLILFNISGQKVLEQMLTDKHNLVNVNYLPVGTYFYELSAPNSNTVKGNIAITK